MDNLVEKKLKKILRKGDDLQERLVAFAILIIKLSSQLPNNREGRHIANQVLKSGTSPAPNYGEARAAESTNDFIHKLKICLKEMNETEIWLQIIEGSEILKTSLLRIAMNECRELCRILNASIKTVVQNRKNRVDN